jgi:hypothetical protein
MRWASDWRIYYIAAALFLIAALIAYFNDGLGLRPVLRGHGPARQQGAQGRPRRASARLTESRLEGACF